MKNILCFLYDTYVDFEIALVCSYLNLNENIKITYISYDKDFVLSSAGLTVKPDLTVKEALTIVNEIDGLIIPGGFESPFHFELKELIRKLYDGNKLLAAICAGPEFLAKSGNKYKKSKYILQLNKIIFIYPFNFFLSSLLLPHTFHIVFLFLHVNFL